RARGRERAARVERDRRVPRGPLPRALAAPAGRAHARADAAARAPRRPLRRAAARRALRPREPGAARRQGGRRAALRAAPAPRPAPRFPAPGPLRGRRFADARRLRALPCLLLRDAPAPARRRQGPDRRAQAPRHLVGGRAQAPGRRARRRGADKGPRGGDGRGALARQPGRDRARRAQRRDLIGGDARRAEHLVGVLAEARGAPGDPPGALLEAPGRARVAEAPAELRVRNLDLEAARAEVLVLEGLLGRVDHADGDAGLALRAEEELARGEAARGEVQRLARRGEDRGHLVVDADLAEVDVPLGAAAQEDELGELALADPERLDPGDEARELVAAARRDARRDVAPVGAADLRRERLHLHRVATGLPLHGGALHEPVVGGHLAGDVRRVVERDVDVLTLAARGAV